MLELDSTDRPRLLIAYQPPYDWDAIIAFLAARATPGVESVVADRYERTVSVLGQAGTIAISPSRSDAALALESDFDDPRAHHRIVERVRLMFDTNVDPAAITRDLGGDPLLKPILAAHPGIRKAGAWDPFELSVRAVLGQQVSVAAATTIAGRVAARWGTPVERRGLSRLFPTPEQLAEAPLEEAGIVGARAATLRSLACAVRDGIVVFDGVNTREALRSIRGIGAWTAEYIAMRALNEADAFPTGDLVLRKMAGDCSARQLDRLADGWRPWRSYAVILLWQAARDRHARARN